MKAIFLFILCIAIWTPLLFAQEYPVTITAKDENREPVQGILISFYRGDDLVGEETTNFEGIGIIQLNAPGKYSLVARHPYGLPFKQVTISVNQEGNFYALSVPSLPGSIKDDQQPFLKITAEQIARSGYTTLDQILQFSVPGFYATWQGISNGTVFMNPASFRGLGPDQILVLINGKRRHSSSLLNVSNTFGRGSVSNDFNSIPISMIKEVQFIKTSAAVEYGSDAIAGIVNVILKNASDPSRVNITVGGYPANGKWWNGKWTERRNFGNETEATLFLNKLFKLGTAGYLQLGGDLTHLGAINRAGYYRGGIFQKEAFNADSTAFRPIDLNDPQRSQFWKASKYAEGITAQTGRARLGSGSVYANGSYALSETSSIYAFGGYNLKNGRSTGFYRFPKDTLLLASQNLTYGFSPEIVSTISDQYFTAGYTATSGKVDVDLSFSSGGNDLDFYVEDSNNATLDSLSPSEFYSGSLYYRQQVFNATLKSDRLYVGEKKRDYFRLNGGAQWRKETFGITAGDEASYISGSVAPNKDFGVQMLPGFRPEDETERYRYNYGIFGGGTWVKVFNDNCNFYINGYARYEKYTKIRNAGGLVVKAGIGGKHGVFNWGISYNDGFRLPSLHQIYYSGVSNQIVNNVSLKVVNYDNESLVAKNFGIPALRSERSEAWNFNATVRAGKFTFSGEFYLISIYDRIVLSGRFNKTNTPQFKSFFETNGISATQFFVNAVNTRTAGLEASIRLSESKISENCKFSGYAGFDMRINPNQADRISQITPFERLDESVLFGRDSRGYLGKAIANHKLIGQMRFEWDNGFSISPRVTWFGANRYFFPGDSFSLAAKPYLLKDATALDNLNEFGQVRLDQKFKAKPVIDLEIAYACKERPLNFALGCNNLGGFKSNKVELREEQKAGLNAKDLALLTKEYEQDNNWGLFQYSRRVQTFGVGGVFIYLKVGLDF